jgi:hypothetical protein
MGSVLIMMAEIPGGWPTSELPKLTKKSVNYYGMFDCHA